MEFKPQRNWYKKDELIKYQENLENGTKNQDQKNKISEQPISNQKLLNDNLIESKSNLETKNIQQITANDSIRINKDEEFNYNNLNNINNIQFKIQPSISARRLSSSEDGLKDDSEDSSEDESNESFGSGESESGEDSESESSDEEDIPIFVPKSNRKTILTEEEKLKMEIEEQEKKQKLHEEKVLKSKAIVARILVEREMRLEKIQAKEENGVSELNDNEDIPDDNDEIDKEIEFEKWKERELIRLIEFCQISIDRKKELERAERRRKLTDEEIMEENRKLGLHEGVDKGEWNFLQKYYHQGAFFQDPSLQSETVKGVDLQELFKRKIQPTGLEKVDKTLLPKIMQKRNYGKKSQTKYTHLTDQDTTDFNYGFGQKNSFSNDFHQKYYEIKNQDSRSNPNKKRKIEE